MKICGWDNYVREDELDLFFAIDLKTAKQAADQLWVITCEVVCKTQLVSAVAALWTATSFGA